MSSSSPRDGQKGGAQITGSERRKGGASDLIGGEEGVKLCDVAPKVSGIGAVMPLGEDLTRHTSDKISVRLVRPDLVWSGLEACGGGE